MIDMQNNQTVEKEKEFPTQSAVKQGRRKSCRYFNKGHCKYREKCKFYHSKNVCQKYLENEKCECTDCSYRHPNILIF